MNVHEIIEENKRDKKWLLDLSNQGLTELPENIGELLHLEAIWLHDNELTKLPKSIGKLLNLKNLELHDNKLTELPDNLGNLMNLEKINLNNNKLKRLPESIGNLKNLRILWINHNNIDILPLSFKKLRLELFSIGDNKLEIFPDLNGKYLTSIHITNNKLKYLPISIMNLDKLDRLFTWGNDFGVDDFHLDMDWGVFLGKEEIEEGLKIFKNNNLLRK